MSLNRHNKIRFTTNQIKTNSEEIEKQNEIINQITEIPDLVNNKGLPFKITDTNSIIYNVEDNIISPAKFINFTDEQIAEKSTYSLSQVENLTSKQREEITSEIITDLSSEEFEEFQWQQFELIGYAQTDEDDPERITEVSSLYYQWKIVFERFDINFLSTINWKILYRTKEIDPLEIKIYEPQEEDEYPFNYFAGVLNFETGYHINTEEIEFVAEKDASKLSSEEESYLETIQERIKKVTIIIYVYFPQTTFELEEKYELVNYYETLQTKLLFNIINPRTLGSG